MQQKEDELYQKFVETDKLIKEHYDDMKIKQITAKTLLITGEQDIGSKPQMSKEISKLIDGSFCKIIKGGKHLCNIECSKNFNLIIRKFIDNSNNA